MGIKGKKLLVLGGTYASYNLVKLAKDMGVYTIVTDYYENGVAKEIADEAINISTADIESLSVFVRDRYINGIISGPSEFNIRNMIRLAEVTGLPCYTSMEVWNSCANKDEFTSMCREYGVNVPREYDFQLNADNNTNINYPVIVKPVDCSSSVGISVCKNEEQLKAGYIRAKEASICKRVIIEDYIDNGGEIFGARYIVKNGEAYPYLLIDTYVVDPINRTSLISAFTYTPSKYSKYYLENMDKNVRRMIKGFGIKEGTVFFQGLPYNDKIYFHEMGYRLSGGMIYKLTEPLVGINDMKMMIKLALGEETITQTEINNIDINCNNMIGAQLMIPLNKGKIGGIQCLKDAINLDTVVDFIQYHYEGDCIEEKNIGTLQQHFGRFTFISDSINQIKDDIKIIHKIMNIYDTNGRRMNTMKFELQRIKK